MIVKHNNPCGAATAARLADAFQLAWDGDPGHPLATAERLHDLVPGSALHVARTPAELRTWGERTVGFLR